MYLHSVVLSSIVARIMQWIVVLEKQLNKMQNLKNICKRDKIPTECISERIYTGTSKCVFNRLCYDTSFPVQCALAVGDLLTGAEPNRRLAQGEFMIGCGWVGRGQSVATLVPICHMRGIYKYTEWQFWGVISGILSFDSLTVYWVPIGWTTCSSSGCGLWLGGSISSCVAPLARAHSR